MKKEINPKVKKGDKVICIYMDGEVDVPPGTKGVVTEVSKDPFEDEGVIIKVNWNNGSSLSLISATDNWVLDTEKTIKEQNGNREHEFLSKNLDLIEHFDWRFLREYLYKLKNSGIVNMFAAAPLLYCGRDHLERYYGENNEDNEDFQEVLEMADEAKDKIIQGVLSYMQAKGLSLDDISKINSLARNFAIRMATLYMTI